MEEENYILQRTFSTCSSLKNDISSDNDDAPPVGQWTSIEQVNLVCGKIDDKLKAKNKEKDYIQTNGVIARTPGNEMAALMVASHMARKASYSRETSDNMEGKDKCWEEEKEETSESESVNESLMDEGLRGECIPGMNLVRLTRSKTSDANGPLAGHKFPTGTLVSKKFTVCGHHYKGRVFETGVGVDTSLTYKALYDDGDAEVITEEDLVKIITTHE